MKIGFIGLGRMGTNMVKKILNDHEVTVWNRSPDGVDELKQKLSQSQLKNLKVAESIEDLVKSQDKPRVIWSMVLIGEPTKQVLGEVVKWVEKGDIIIDGGNAFYKDTQKRYEQFREKSIRFLGIGVSGGIISATSGYPTMAGGDKSAYEYIRPILDSLGKPYGGHEYFGEGGAGHFVKMVHNGIEYGIMQSLGEGFDVLEYAPYKFDLLKIGKLYQKKTLVSGFMLDRAVEVLEEDPHLGQITGVIDANGEAEWTVQQAKEEGISVEIIEHTLNYRTRSQTDEKIQSSYTAKMIAALRRAFGAHGVYKKK